MRLEMEGKDNPHDEEIKAWIKHARIFDYLRKEGNKDPKYPLMWAIEKLRRGESTAGEISS